jgi:hypothetical protein
MAQIDTVWDAVGELLGFVALWTVASIPAYWVFSVWLQLRRALSVTLSAFLSHVRTGRVRRRELLMRLRSELAQRVQLIEVDTTAATAWATTLATVLEGVRSGGALIEEARQFAAEALRKLERTARGLQSLRLISAVVPHVPAIGELAGSAQRRGTAAINLTLGALLLVPIICANSMLTGLVLEDVIPPVQPMFGIPVAYALAAVIVIAEIAVGVIHSVEAESRHGTERQFTMGSLVANLAAVAVITIETWLYSRVQPNTNFGAVSFGGSMFGVVGAILGFAVFGLGRVAHSSLIAIRKERTSRSIAKGLERLRRSADEWNMVAARLEPTRRAASEQFERLVDLCRQTADAQGQAIHQFVSTLAAHRESAPPWARPTERSLTRSEFGERESRAYLWSAVAVLALTSMTVAAAQFASRTDSISGAAVGFGLAVTAFACGSFASQNAPRRIRWRVAIYLMLLAAVGGLTLAAGHFLRREMSLHAVMMFIPAVTAFGAGLQVGPITTFLQLPILWTIHRLADMLGALVVAALWTFTAVAAAVEYVTLILAWPTAAVVRAILSKRNQSEHVRAA